MIASRPPSRLRRLLLKETLRLTFKRGTSVEQEWDVLPAELIEEHQEQWQNSSGADKRKTICPYPRVFKRSNAWVIHAHNVLLMKAGNHWDWMSLLVCDCQKYKFDSWWIYKPTGFQYNNIVFNGKIVPFRKTNREFLHLSIPVCCKILYSARFCLQIRLKTRNYSHEYSW